MRKFLVLFNIGLKWALLTHLRSFYRHHLMLKAKQSNPNGREEMLHTLITPSTMTQLYHLMYLKHPVLDMEVAFRSILLDYIKKLNWLKANS